MLASHPQSKHKMKEGRNRLKDVTNVTQKYTKVEEIEDGCVISDSELFVLDDVIMDESTDLILGDYQIKILVREEDGIWNGMPSPSM